ncbi:hypothetical protein CMI44_01920 [Candidatus Pacearchaeota archaeon]|nr:hypothetical protein [Candidatus Pacearchaeota archaeon]|tara:strand:+ start:279 stop:896 length:618 start_codon:yes stop_codon:yes gene_type:complete
MAEKTQIWFIHGGTTFKSKNDYLNFLKNRSISIEKKRKWSERYLDKELSEKFEIIRPTMPLKENARYEDWKIHFEKHFSHLKDKIILIGSSLGGVFLTKYLSENIFPKKILSVYLIAPPFDNTLSDEYLGGGFELQDNLSMIEKNCKNLNLFFSKNDDVVPISHAQKYKMKLKNANRTILDNKNGHFKVSEFPEIVKMIKEDIMP